MAEAITLTCPECGKRINVASEAVGKKIRCKGCEHVFAVQAPVEKKAAKPAAAKKKAPAPQAVQPKPKKPKDDDDDDPNPYGVTALDTAPRCPDCANELESADAIICLHCGYNSRTRMKIESRAVEDVTGGTWTLWLLPGILCAVGLCIILTFDFLYTFTIGHYFEDDTDVWYAFISYAPFIIWAVWAPSILLMVGLGTFAVRRLVLHPRPPERVKKKPKKAAE